MSLGVVIANINALICLIFRMSIGVVKGLKMIPKWCLIQDSIIEGEIVAFTPGRDIYMLTLDEV